MEWGILLALTVAVLGAGAYARLRGLKRHRSDRETGNIYPLW